MSRRLGDRSGFVLALVVLMLFAITMAAAAGYLAVRTEFSLAIEYEEGIEALTVARGGLQRFLGEQIGTLGDSVSYAIGKGIATVTSRRIVGKDAHDYLYYVRSEGKVSDPRYPNAPADRVVGTYAWLHVSPVIPRAAVLAAMDTVDVSGASAGIIATVDGHDHATPSECPGGGTPPIVGAIGAMDPRITNGGSLQGSPNKASYGSVSAVIDSSGVRWNVLSNPGFPVEFDGSPPDWSSLPSDSFPVVRYAGDLNAGPGWAGRGVLIVTGRLTMETGFHWNGIVLAGGLGDVGALAAPTVNGLLVAGLNGADSAVVLYSGVYDYNSCDASAANRSLSYLDPVEKTVVDVD